MWDKPKRGAVMGKEYMVDLNSIQPGKFFDLGQEHFTCEVIEVDDSCDGRFWPWPTKLLGSRVSLRSGRDARRQARRLSYVRATLICNDTAHCPTLRGEDCRVTHTLPKPDLSRSFSQFRLDEGKDQGS